MLYQSICCKSILTGIFILPKNRLLCGAPRAPSAYPKGAIEATRIGQITAS